jgi:5-formyltetrahydrofolate cyclo-ligase
MTKAELRRTAAERRQGMPDEVRAKASALIAQRLFSLKEWKMAETVFLYCGCKDEVNTDEITDMALKEGKKVSLPRVISDSEMVFIEISSAEELVTGAYGIREPEDRGIYTQGIPDLILIPCVGVDMKGHRIGHGKGYYDRFLSGFDGVSVGICYYNCLIDELPSDKFDICVDHLITENKSVSFGLRKEEIYG